MNLFARAAYVLSAMTAFLVLARRVRAGRTGGFDERVTRAIQRTHRPWFDWIMRLVSLPGYPPQSRIIPWLIPVGLFARGYRLEAAFQLLGWGTGGVSGLVKFIVRRPRPDLEDITVVPARIRGTSFPSGHVIIYTGVYGFLAYLTHCHLSIRWLRRTIVGALTAMLAMVGPSRVYLGHHWLSDVLASYLLGTSYVALLTAAYQRARASKAR